METIRDILLEPFLSILYYKIKYHFEHQMYPGVPFCKVAKSNSLISNKNLKPQVGICGVFKVKYENNRKQGSDCALG